MNKLDPKKKVKAHEYLTNLGMSAKDLIVKFINDTPLFQIVGDKLEEFHAHNQNKDKKITLKSISDAQAKNFWKWMDEDRIDDGSYKDDLKDLFTEFIKGLKTGKWTHKDANDFADLIDDDPAYLFVDEGFGEYYIEGGKMNLNEFKNNAIKKLKMSAVGESLNELSTIDTLNDKIIEVKNDILAEDTTTQKDTSNEINDFNHDKSYEFIKDKIINLTTVTSTNPEIKNKYEDVLSDAATAAIATHLNYKSNNLQNDNILKEATKDIKELSSKCSLGEVLDKKLAEVKYLLEEKVKEREFKKVNEEDLSENVPATPIAESAGDILGIGGLTTNLVTALFAIPINLMNKNEVDKIQSKYGSNFTFKQPMVAGNNLSSEFISKYAKALEVKELIEMKGLIEATASQMDGGSVVSRAAKGSKILSPLNIELREAAKNAVDTNITYDEIVSAFSESGKDFFKRIPKLSTTIAKSFISVINRNAINYDLILDHDQLVGKGEYGDFIEHRRNALPSYMEVNIEYAASSDITSAKVDNRTRKTTLGLQILPRKIDAVDIDKTLLELNDKLFSKVQVTKDERSFIKKLGNLLEFWKDKSNKNEKEVLKSNTFSNIINKISHIKSPLFHLVISFSDYTEMKNTHKFDLMNTSTYKSVMKNLPLISLTIVDEDSDVLYLSEGENMSYIRHSIDDFIDTVAQYEKELKTILKYNQI